MRHKAAMSEQPSAGQRAGRAADRMRARVGELRALGEGAYAAVPEGLRRGIRRAVSLAVLVVIGWVLYRQLEDTNWAEVLRSLPSSPWFYLFFLARFFIVPVTEVLCYSAVWGANLFRYFGVFLIKHILNSAVAGFSGDMHFMLWAVRTLRMSYRRAFSAIKDVTLLSAVASNAVTVLVLGAYLGFGDLTLVQSVGTSALGLIVGITLVAAVLSLLTIVFRGRLLAVGTSIMGRIIGYHTARASGSLLLAGLQWTAGLPGPGFLAWMSLIVVEMLVGRLPPFPGRPFIFLSLALHLAGTINAPEAQVTALLLTDSALRHALLVPSFIAGALWKTRPHPLPLNPDDGAAEERAPAAP
jgi:hypothetical protein